MDEEICVRLQPSISKNLLITSYPLITVAVPVTVLIRALVVSLRFNGGASSRIVVSSDKLGVFQLGLRNCFWPSTLETEEHAVNLPH